ncbi:MAG: MFS transporter, partial [Rhodospirillaceae bacterium]|nr:MFS transporter [Rhodospirillaceae bacterium]
MPASRAALIGWASGTIGSSTMLGAMSLLVMFYLTEYLGISPALAGALIFVSRIWDIGASLVVGQWSDRIAGRWAGRWGRRVPFLAVGGPVAALSYMLLFAAPADLGQGALAAYVLAALILYATGYSLFVVPYLAVPAEITSVPQQRTTMMAMRVVAMTVAGLNVAVLGPVLIGAFGTGRAGYAGMGAVQGGIILAAMWICTIVVARAPSVASAAASPAGSLAQVVMVLRNRPFLIFLGVKFCQLTAAASTTVALLYLARYVLDQDENFLIRFGAFQTIGTLASLPAWSWLAARYGKRRTYMGAWFFYAAVVISWLATALGEPGWVTDARILLIGVATSGLLVMGFSLLPDTMEHNTRITGVGQEGTMAAVYSMVEKGTAAAGPLIGGVLLELSGFISAEGGALPPEQPASAIVAIFALVAVIPAVFNVAGSLLLTRFTLTDAP